MIDLDKLPKDVLHAVRQRAGAKGESDDSFDDTIRQMYPEGIAARYAGWYLGDDLWGHKIVDVFKVAQAAEVKG